MRANSQYRVEHVARTPHGWKVRSRKQGGHVVRLAFPPGRKKRGSGKVVEILHPAEESNPCRNPGFDEVVNDSKGRIWGIAVQGHNDKWTAQGYPIKGKHVSGSPIVVHGTSESDAYDRLSDRIDRKNPQPQKNPLDAAALERIAKAAEKRGLSLANPDGETVTEQVSEAKELYSTFHGRDPKGVIEQMEADEVRGTYTALGKLAELTFHTSAKQKVILDFYSESTKLASNPEGTQLYLIGGNQSLDASLDKFGSDATKDFVDLGECTSVVYLARKSQTQFQEAGWKHKFGEEGGARPWGFYDRIRQRIYLVGGDYRVEAPGIIN